MRLSVTQTATALAGGSAAACRCSPTAPAPFTGAITRDRRAEPSALPAASRSIRRCWAIPPSSCSIGPGTAIGDPTRPNFIYDQLTNASFAFSAQTGLGNASSPFTGNLPAYLRQVLSMQGEAAANASNLAQGQDVVVNALQQRVNDASGVNVDQEMANLITLQTAYGANARVMTAVRDMIDTLMKM